MTSQDLQSLMIFSEEFLKDNDGNKLNKWLSGIYLANLRQRLSVIVQADMPKKGSDDAIMPKGK